MTDYKPITNADVYQSKAEYRKQRAQEPFEKKLQAVVRMQRLEYSIAQSMGRKCSKPWHTKVESPGKAQKC